MKNHGLVFNKTREKCTVVQWGNAAEPDKNIRMHRIFFLGKACPIKSKEVDLIYFVFKKRKFESVPGKSLTFSFSSVHFKEDPYDQKTSKRTLSDQ